MNAEIAIGDYLQYNNAWATQILKKSPDYFKELSQGQVPNALLLGCSDSRVSPSLVTGANLGELFVHRNIANVVAHSDLNFLSVLQYAVEVLKVKDIIIYGHYGCGGIQAAMSGNDYGLIDNWLANIRDVMALNRETLDAITDEKERFDKLVELNVLQQAENLKQSSVYRKALARNEAPNIHCWVYDFSTGKIDDLLKKE